MLLNHFIGFSLIPEKNTFRFNYLLKHSRLVYLIAFMMSFLIHVNSQSATELVRKAEEKGRGTSSQALIKIQTVRPKWTREIQLKAWTKGKEMSMILITEPTKDRGIAFLKKNKEIWNWIPNIERHIKLPPSMMTQSWMGTDFTNDDLVKESSIVEDYTQEIIGEEKIGQFPCSKIELRPKEHAAVIWNKIILWIYPKEFLLLKAEYFDEDDMLVNRMQAFDVKMFGDRLLPSRMIMEPSDKPGHQTVMTYISLAFDVPIQDQFFSTQNLSRLK